MPTITFINPQRDSYPTSITVTITGQLTLTASEISELTRLFFFIHEQTYQIIAILYSAFQNLNPRDYFHDPGNFSNIQTLETLHRPYKEYKNSIKGRSDTSTTNTDPGQKFIKAIKKIYSWRLRGSRTARIAYMRQFLENEHNLPIHRLAAVLAEFPPSPAEHSQPNKTQITGYWSLLAITETISDWNATFKRHLHANRLVILNQHLAFLCHILYEFIDVFMRRPPENRQDRSYGRYISKNEWSVQIPPHTENFWLNKGLGALDQPNAQWNSGMPFGMKGHGMLFFTVPTNPHRFCVLFKSDTQVTPKPGQRPLRFVFSHGATKIVKLHGLLFEFDYDSKYGTIELFKMTKVVTISTSRLYVPQPHGPPKRNNFEDLLRRRADDFLTWNIFSFESNKPEPNASRLIAYQSNQGSEFHYYITKNWTSIQKLYACFTFLFSVKSLLESGFWPFDLKDQNMGLTYKSIPEFAYQVNILSIFDFISYGATYSLYKENNGSQYQSMCMPISMETLAQLIQQLNHRGQNRSSLVPPGENPVPTLAPKDFGYLIAQLFFEISFNLFNIWNEYSELYRRDWFIFRGILPHQSVFNTNTNFCKEQCFYSLLRQSIYETGLNPGHEAGPTHCNPAYVITPEYARQMWQSIGNEIATRVWYETMWSLTPDEPPLPNNIYEHAVFGPFYDELFGPEALQDFFNLIQDFPHTESPFPLSAIIHELAPL